MVDEQTRAARREREVVEWLARHDAACPGCGYQMRGMTSALCPECGARFTSLHALSDSAWRGELAPAWWEGALGLVVNAALAGALASAEWRWGTAWSREAVLHTVAPQALAVLGWCGAAWRFKQMTRRMKRVMVVVAWTPWYVILWWCAWLW